jgi:GTPases
VESKLSKVEEIIRSYEPDTVITYHQLNPVQYVNLGRRLRIRVMDRVWLILEIFRKEGWF